MALSWGMAPSGELSRLIQSGSITFDELIVHEKLKEDFRRQDQILHNFLLHHAEELTNTALGFRNAGNEIAQGISFQLILSQIQSFSRKLAQTPKFLETMHDAIFQHETFEGKTGPAFSRIFQFMVQSSLAPFLSSFPEKEKLFRELVKMYKVPAIANLLVYLTDNTDTRVTNFLEENNAIQVLIEKMNGDEENDSVMVKFILNIIVSIEPDSPILSPLLNPSLIERFFNIGIKSNNSKLAGNSLNILIQLISRFDEDTSGVDHTLMQTTLQFVTSHIPEICEFIKSDKPFLAPKFNSTELLAAAVIMLSAIPEDIWDVLEYLWFGIFEHPAHSFLHRSFLTLFESILGDSPDIDTFIDRVNMHNMIIDAYAKKKETIASYWPYLYTVADFISNKGKCNQEWRNFIHGQFAQITDIISKDYGGECPHEDFFESDSDDFQFTKDLVFDDSDDSDDDMLSWGNPYTTEGMAEMKVTPALRHGFIASDSDSSDDEIGLPQIDDDPLSNMYTFQPQANSPEEN